jgi:hypothetical protein
VSWGHRPKPAEVRISRHVLDEAAAAVLKAVRVDRTHDVPYVGSCNRRGDVIYIDYQMPTHLTSRGKRYDIDRYIVFHEVVEMLFEHQLKLEYRDAHQIALRAERALVESDGLSWPVYCRFCSQWSKRIGNRRVFPNPPRDLDLQPEIDEVDRPTLQRLNLGAKTKAALREGTAPASRRHELRRDEPFPQEHAGVAGGDVERQARGEPRKIGPSENRFHRRRR